MRQEDKEIDGFELEREEQLKRDEHAAKDEVPDEGQQADREHPHTGVIAGAMQAIFERDHVDIDALGLPQREQIALEALRTAVEARDPEINSFVFATDRRALLEQALAILQPDLATLQQRGAVPFQEMLHEITELRQRLGSLRDAQFPLKGKKRAVKAEESDKDDDEDDADDTSLTGPERAIDKPASSLTGPEREQEPKPASSLIGPERKEEPKPPTTVGDPKEIAAAAQPWWKR